MRKYNESLDLCNNVKRESSTLANLKTYETVVLSIISIIFDFAFDFLAKLEGYSDYNKRQSSVLFKLFFWKYMISSLFPVLTTTDVFDHFIKGDQQLKAYDDFTPVWYREVGSGLILSMYIRVLIIIGVFIYRYYWPRLFQWWDRGGICKPLAIGIVGFRSKNKGGDVNTKMKRHRDLIWVYKNQHFDIERSYAEVLNTIFFCLTYWVMLPHIFLPCLLILTTIYYKDKILSK